MPAKAQQLGDAEQGTAWWEMGPQWMLGLGGGVGLGRARDRDPGRRRAGLRAGSLMFQKEDVGISRKTLEGTYTSRSFQGAQGWVLLQLCIILILASLHEEAAIIFPAPIPPSAA